MQRWSARSYTVRMASCQRAVLVLAPLRTPAEAEERAELQQRRQTQAMQIFKMQQKQYEPAYMNKLDEYIVGNGVMGFGLYRITDTDC